MTIMKLLLYVLVVLGCQALTIQSENCRIENNLSGYIEHRINAGREEVCWIIKVPKRNTVTISVKSLSFESNANNGLEITEIRTGKQRTFDRYSGDGVKELNFGSDVKITHYARNSYSYYWSTFSLYYEIDNGFLPASVVGDSLRRGVSWLRGQSTDTMSWKENTPRAVVALFLASDVNFNGTVFEEELMATQVELKTSVALLKSSNTINDMSMLLNALLVTCYNPRKFHGIDVVERLKTEVVRSRGVTHPIAYLSLCNANETWPAKAFNDLESILDATTDFSLNIDMKAMAVMALSCYLNRQEGYRTSNTSNNTYTQDTIEHFKSLQLEDGSFGNVYTTALIAHALISEGDQDWNTTTTAEYLVKKMKSSINFLTAYFVLPIFNGKTLVDISHMNCSAHPRKHGDDIVEEIEEDVGPKIQVRHSLYIGDSTDVIHTIFLKVPQGFTAYQVMKLAEIQNPKFKFESKNISGKINVFEIADLPNDPESGKYWLLYMSSSNETESLTHSTKSPNELIMQNDQHLVMWYRSYNL